MEAWVLIPITAVFMGLFLAMRNERVRRILRCPVYKIPADVEVVQRYHEPSKPVRVKRCSLLNSKQVTCQQTCIHQAL